MSTAPARPAAEIACRRVENHEIQSAMAIILGTADRPAPRSQVAEFIHFAAQRNVNIRETWVALVGGEIAWAALPVVSPGRTLLLFSPAHCCARAAAAAAELVERICDFHGHAGVHLAQVLVDPEQSAVREFFGSLGFREMAELIYLNGHAPRGAKTPELPTNITWQDYSEQTHSLFAQAILESYHESQDCPALGGLRDIEDVIAGHKATGEFESGLWRILCENQKPVGVLLLSRIPRADSLELVYLGLSPSVRGRGIGNLLMRQAMHQVVSDGRRRLTLAVDSRNAPALKLYYSHGLQRLTTKMAMIRDLRAKPE
jgi:ribosomal protein S18 acetylase RimI-like enzyme